MAVPFLKCLVRVFRIAEVGNSAETLLHAVIAIGSGLLERSQYAQGIEEIAAQPVLSTLAAGQRH